MKEPSKWSELDLHELIKHRVPESLTLDYKAAGALQATDGKKNEISKDVSSFANSAGGTVVYGIAEEHHVPTRIDGCDPLECSKEWLEQVINSRIQRRIAGIVVNQVELSTTGTGRVAYVVVIPQSKDAPHQAADKRFYKRFNFESVPMEEYEIRDVSRRLDCPVLDVALAIATNTPQLSSSEQGSNESFTFELVASVGNASAEPATAASFSVIIDSRLKLLPVVGLVLSGATNLTSDAGPIAATVHQQNWIVPSKMPIFDGIRFKLTDENLRILVPRLEAAYILGWSASAPRTTKREGFYRLRVTRGFGVELTTL